jgi:hypothetical protein
MQRTIQDRKYGLRVMDRDAVTSPGLAGSLSYAMQRHHETGRPYLCSIYGHAMIDCPHNRELLKQLDAPIAATTKAL